MRAITTLILAFVLFSCNNNKTNSILNTDAIPVQEYMIDVNRDTVLQTKNGALIKIPKGALTTGKGNTVALEIKEAYTMKQMVQAGLVTQSDGQPLSSGGMLYINAKDGAEVKISEALKVAIPADYLGKDMKLFRGEKDENGNINWKDPVALPENRQLSSLEKGELLFQSKCATCHGIGKEMTGPDLAHLIKRFGTPYNSEAGGKYQYFEHGFYPYKPAEPSDSKSDGITFRVYDRHDPFYPYKCNLVTSFGAVGPILFNDSATNNEIDDIYRYIQDESDKRDLPLPAHHSLMDCADSCISYIKTIEEINKRKEAINRKRDGLMNKNGEMVEEDEEPGKRPIPGNTVPPTVDFEERVSPNYYDAEYYQFNIDRFGWHNIDVLVKDMDGAKESELFVNISGEFTERLKAYLIIPSAKIFVEGGPTRKNENEFAFDKTDGKIILPQDSKAYVLVLTEAKEKIAYALKEFAISPSQRLGVSLTATTKEAFNEAMNNLPFDSLDIKVKDSKKAKKIRKADAQLKKADEALKDAENLKPKNCNCYCGAWPATVPAESVPVDYTIDISQ